nr:MAG TPA: restriction alleviation protein [Caudoviricetes sp.]
MERGGVTPNEHFFCSFCGGVTLGDLKKTPHPSPPNYPF